jgi:nuclear pore complex protein Nup85
LFFLQHPFFIFFFSSRVAQIAARNFLHYQEYGLAVSYATSAENWTWLGRIVDGVLGQYIKHGLYMSLALLSSHGIVGPEVFARSVAAVAPTLQELRAHPGANGVFTHRLMFAVRYAEFHQRRLRGDLQEAALDLLTMFNEDLAPKSWWGVLLCDAVELIRNGELSSVLLLSNLIHFYYR